MQHQIKKWYRNETYLQLYNFYLQPVRDMKLWLNSKTPTIQPPKPKKQLGMLKLKRKKDIEEPTSKISKYSRTNLTIRCSKYKEFSHNKKGARQVRVMLRQNLD